MIRLKIISSLIMLLIASSNSVFAEDALLTCYILSQKICGEYSFKSKRKQQQFISSCRSGGASIIEDEHSCSKNVGYCVHSTGQISVKTYAYGRDQSTVKRNCEANGGTYKGG